MVERDQYVDEMLQILRRESGLDTRDTTGYSFRGRSVEITVGDERYVYLGEFIKYDGDFFGYEFLFCLTNDQLPEELSTNQERQIIQTFRDTSGIIGDPHYTTAYISHPYVREVVEPENESYYQEDKRALWLEMHFLYDDPEEMAHLLPGFINASKKISTDDISS